MDMSKHFTTGQLIRYSLPAMVMMVFTSIYGVVDGFFVSNFAGKAAFAAVNLIWPFVMILGSVGFMTGSGGSALVSATRGEGDDERANGYFSMIILFTFVFGTALALIGAATMEQVARALGSNDAMLENCVLYGRISMVSMPLFMLQYAFQAFASTAGKPKFGLYVTVASGVANMVLDLVFVGILGWGVAGAAWATVVSEYIGGLAPVVYFAKSKTSLIKLGKPVFSLRALGKTCANGSSEMVSNVAMSVVAIVYNLQLISYLGENGVDAYGTIDYASLIFGGILMGYCMGTAPLMSYQHGAGNNAEKKSIFRKSIRVMFLGGVAMFGLAQLLAYPIAWVFTSYDAELLALTEHALRLYSLCLILMGFNMYGSSLFTALGNGPVSAIIAGLRTLVFEIGAVLILPSIVGADGIWFSVSVAEIASFVITCGFILWLGRGYGIR